MLAKENLQSWKEEKMVTDRLILIGESLAFAKAVRL